MSPENQWLEVQMYFPIEIVIIVPIFEGHSFIFGDAKLCETGCKTQNGQKFRTMTAKLPENKPRKFDKTIPQLRGKEDNKTTHM